MGLIALTLLYIYLRMREARKQRMEEQARNDMQQAVADYVRQRYRCSMTESEITDMHKQRWD